MHTYDGRGESAVLVTEADDGGYMQMGASHGAKK